MTSPTVHRTFSVRALVLGILISLAVAAGAWLAYSRGWLTSAYHWAHQWASQGGAGKSDHGGMDMNMPGMDMGPKSMGQSDMSSDVPGHAVVMIPPDVQQRIGVTTGVVEKAPLRMSVRTVGIVRPDETKVAHVHLKTEGWVDKLFVDYTGKVVHKGDPLLSIYSPEFLTTQQEYLSALQGGQESLAELSRRRLELWDVPPQELDELRQTRKPHKNLTLRSPLDGTVLTKNAFEGQRVTPQDELYVLADLSTVWVQAKVYEYELPHVELGQPAIVTFPELPGTEFTGKVVFIQPTVEEATRTVQVRVELPNAKRLFKPGMFANVTIQHTMGEGLLVPTSAVIRTGERDIAFRAESGDHFVPVEITISAWRFGDHFHVVKGLQAGDKVVTSANFLIDSESRLRLGGGMAGMPGMDMDGMKGMDHSKMKH
jgi:Cu(I)/Ag(I) efflux system membrane fusion protein